MLKNLFFALTLIFSSPSFAAERNYAASDGTLDFKCQMEDDLAQPFHFFSFQMLWDINTGKSMEEFFSDKNLASGNGDIVYKIDIIQLPSKYAEIPSHPQNLPGCEAAPLMITLNKNENIEIYFECRADGDAGYGTLTIDLSTKTVNGVINFPEGQSQLTYPISDDTTYNLKCSK